MSQVRKGNRIITIEPHKVDDFIARGYDLIEEETGEVVKKGNPVSLNDYKREYSALKEKLKEKDAEIEELQSSNETLKAELEELKAKSASKTPTKSKAKAEE